jgi:hypothetical protein
VDLIERSLDGFAQSFDERIVPGNLRFYHLFVGDFDPHDMKCIFSGSDEIFKFIIHGSGGKGVCDYSFSGFLI